MSVMFVSVDTERTLSNLISALLEATTPMGGLRKELKMLKESLSVILELSKIAEQRQRTSSSVEIWLTQLQAVVYDAEDALDEVVYELLRQKVDLRKLTKGKVCMFFSVTTSTRFYMIMTPKIERINERLKEIIARAAYFNFSRTSIDIAPHRTLFGRPAFLGGPEEVVGRESDLSKVMNLLISSTNQQVLTVVPIVGMPGVGKTTLAKMVCKGANEKKLFDIILWVCVGENFDVRMILGDMLKTLKANTGEITEMDAILALIEKELENKNFLLVLDDVWDEQANTWDCLNYLLNNVSSKNGNVVIVTTHNRHVASMMKTYSGCSIELRGLSDDECWSIIKQKVCSGYGSPIPSDFEAIGMEIAKKCGGVPLVASVLGGVMASDLDKKSWLSIERNVAWDLLEDNSRTLDTLKSIFDFLPSPILKRCFAYCSIFPKDFYVEKEQLVQLWMAEGLLPTPPLGLSTEDIGDMYFGVLLARYFLEEAKRDRYGDIIGFKMHHLMHDLAISVSKSVALNLEVGSVDDTSSIRHINSNSHNFEEVQLASLNKPCADNLRTLFSKVDFFSKSWKCKRLRTLNLDGADIEELPTSIGNLKRLRYLDVSRTKIKALPESITELFLLQTLRLSECMHLEKLPQKTTNLVSLRHLHFTEDHHMPADVGSLTSLVTLPIFVVEQDRGNRIGVLGSLRELRGDLWIRNLEQVRERGEAHRATVLGKGRIKKLRLEWRSYSERESNSHNINDEDVLEGLQPHQNIKVLEIVNYAGEKFPSWMSQSYLVFLKLENCNNCKQLVHLPCLEVLEITGMVGVSCIGNEFYSANGYLPALKTLSIKRMESLEEWLAPAGAGHDTARIAFPCLEDLCIEECHQLKCIPSMSHFSSNLARLKISKCRALRHLSGTPEHLQELYIASCPELIGYGINVPPFGAADFPKLQAVSIYDCPKLAYLPISGSFSKFHMERCWELNTTIIDHAFSSSGNLQSLIIRGYNKLTSVPDGFGGSFNCLVELEITWCRSLISFPEDCFRPLLRLRRLRMGPFSKELEAVPGMSSIHHLSGCLEELHVFGWGKLKSIPDQLQHLASLTSLWLTDFNGLEKEALPEWFGHLYSLQSLRIGNCWNLKYLPTTETMNQLRKLGKLHIKNCPLLERNCAKNSGQEWPKISRISAITINNETLQEKGESSRSQ